MLKEENQDVERWHTKRQGQAERRNGPKRKWWRGGEKKVGPSNWKALVCDRGRNRRREGLQKWRKKMVQHRTRKNMRGRGRQKAL